MSTVQSMSRLLIKFRSLGHILVQSALDRLAFAYARGQDSGAGPLVLVKVDAIGDFVVWLSAAERLVTRHRPRRVVLIANRIVAELARASGMFDEVLTIDTAAFIHDRRYRFVTLRKIRNLRASIAIQPSYSRSFWVGDAMIRATGAPERIGYSGDFNNIRPWQKRISDRWYTRLVPARSEKMHELQRNADFLRGLGDNDAIPAIGQLGPVARLPEVLKDAPPYFVAVPGAGSTRRMWPIDRFAGLARELAGRHGLRLVVCGSPDERELAEDLARQSGLDDALVLAGMTSLPELVETIRHAQLVIANESSAIHIAAAVGTRAYCFLGGGHFGRFMPYPNDLPGTIPVAIYADMACFNCNWQCTQPHGPEGPYPCLEAIAAETAAEAVAQTFSSME